MKEVGESKEGKSPQLSTSSASEVTYPVVNGAPVAALGFQSIMRGLDFSRHISIENSAIVELVRKITSPLADSAISRMALANHVAPSFMRPIQVTWAAQVAESFGSKIIANAFTSSVAINGFADLFLEQSRLVAKDFELAKQFSALSNSTRVLADWARLNTAVVAKYPSSISSLAALRKYVGSVSPSPTTYQLGNAILGSVATRSFMEIEILESNAVSENLGEIVTRIEGDFREISNRERAITASMLMESLSDLDPAIAELLRGAWEELASPRAAAVSKIANCAVEVIDRTLRKAAPDDEVISWVYEQKDTDDLLHAEKPTRRARIFYILRHRAPERRLLLAEEANFAISARLIHSNLESGKHTDSVSIPQARALLVATESFLTQLIL